MVFGKPPLAGVSKTRLGRTIGSAAAARVAGALLQDTVERFGRLPHELVVATTDPSSDHGVDAPLWDQGNGDLGARIERMLRRAIAEGGWGLAIGADAPHVSDEGVRAALQGLQQGSAVLGPSEDGGFWALGLHQCPSGLLASLPWSAPDTHDAVRARLEARGVAWQALPSGWDVDELDDLKRLVDEGDLAPRSAALAREVLC